MEVRKIRIEDFDYPLPDERIALHPLQERDRCKLLGLNSSGKITHHIFSDLPILLRPDTLIVANETKVIHARMEFIKPSGARIEIFLLEPYVPKDYVVSFAETERCSWVCLVGNRKRWKEGPLTMELKMPGSDAPVVLTAEQEKEPVKTEGTVVKFSWDNPSYSFAEIIGVAGNIPIPPYLKRKSEDADNEDYQTVYSRTEGSVAAPTAGLHFTPELISTLKRYGDEFATVTLHVGAGTFQPVKSEEIGDHSMHTEWISVSRHTLLRILNALKNGRDVLAIGTTSVRTVESLPYLGILARRGEELKVTQWMPYQDLFRNIDTIGALESLLAYLDENGLSELETTTSIMIAPGFRWRIVNRLVTNFHQPKSTLLLLVSSFLGKDPDGKEKWRRAYDEALKNEYRFLSYGDACLFARGPQPVVLPLSKSMQIRRAVITAASHPMAPELLDTAEASCDDVKNLLRALRLTMESTDLPEGEYRKIEIGEGAAPLRFLIAFAASLNGAKVEISCDPALRKRPVTPLVKTLTENSADIEFIDDPDEWKIIIKGKRLKGGKIDIETSVTSQYLSALMMASLLWEDGLSFENEGREMVSHPYVRMTERMIQNLEIRPEPDWSAAAFFYEYALISGKNVEIEALTPPALSLQGDSVCADIYSRLGVNTAFHADGSATLRVEPSVVEIIDREETFEFDFRSCPDLVPAVVVGLCYRKIPFRFTGLKTLRYKETDRIAALQNILVRLGYDVQAGADTLEFNGEFHPYEEFPLEIDPYGDHRIAMAFYPLELKGMVFVEDKGVVSKSYPNFYQQI